MNDRFRIAITEGTPRKPSFEKYLEWLRSVEPAIEFVPLSADRDNHAATDSAHGLVLTGGGDVHPRFYERPDAVAQTAGVNAERDEFEFSVIERALVRAMPILAICRGMQALNVFLGGSLIVDLQSAGFVDHRSPEGEQHRHPIRVDPHAMMFFAAGGTELEVNSYHHQSVDRLGRGLRAVALSPDGIIEAAEWQVKDDMPFLLAVQWHPERSPDDACSRNIASLYLREVQRFAYLAANAVSPH